MAIYIKYEDIKGNVTSDGYKDNIAVYSIRIGVCRCISRKSGNISNREATRHSISEIVFTKPADISATALFKEAVTGSAGKKVTVKCVQTGSDKVVEYMIYV